MEQPQKLKRRRYIHWIKDQNTEYAACGQLIKRDFSFLIATCPKCRTARSIKKLQDLLLPIESTHPGKTN